MHLFYFEKGIRGQVQAWPKLDGMSDMVRSIRERRMDFGILDIPTVLYEQQVFGAYRGLDTHLRIRQLAVLPETFEPIPTDPRIGGILEFYRFRHE